MLPYMAPFLRTSHNRTAFYSLELTIPSNAALNLTTRNSLPLSHIKNYPKISTAIYPCGRRGSLASISCK